MSCRIWLEVIPSWIVALTSLGTLCAAIVAAVYAARAASATREQANAATADVSLATEALALARGEAERSRDEMSRTAIWNEQRRLDAQLAIVFMEARPVVAYEGEGVGLFVRPAGGAWEELQRGDAVVQGWKDEIRHELTLRMSNLSDLPARIQFVNFSGGELWTEGRLLNLDTPFWLPPRGQELPFVWKRVTAAANLLDVDGIARDEAMSFVLAFDSHSASGDVTQRYEFSGTLSTAYPEGDGAVRVAASSFERWADRVARPTIRRYNRLD